MYATKSPFQWNVQKNATGLFFSFKHIEEPRAFELVWKFRSKINPISQYDAADWATGVYLDFKAGFRPATNFIVITNVSYDSTLSTYNHWLTNTAPSYRYRAIVLQSVPYYHHKTICMTMEKEINARLMDFSV